MGNTDDNTTIRIQKDVKKQLDAIGQRGESFNDIIKRLLNAFGMPITNIDSISK